LNKNRICPSTSLTSNVESTITNIKRREQQSLSLSKINNEHPSHKFSLTENDGLIMRKPSNSISKTEYSKSKLKNDK
jgi:hypothetical protein